VIHHHQGCQPCHPQIVEGMFFAEPCFLAVLQFLMNATDAKKIAPILHVMVEIRDIQYPAIAGGRY